MDRRRFLEILVPGLKDFREAGELDIFCGNSPPEVAKQIEKHIRKGRLKIAAEILAILAIGGGGPWLNYYLNRKRSQRKKELEKAIYADIHSSMRSENLSRFPYEIYINKAGEIEPRTEERLDELGLNLGIASPVRSIKLKDGEEYEFEIDMERVTIQGMSNKKPTGRVIPTPKPTFVSSDYISANNLTSFMIVVPYIYKFEGKIFHRTYNLDYKIVTPSISEEMETVKEVKNQISLIDPATDLTSLPQAFFQHLDVVASNNKQMHAMNEIPENMEATVPFGKTSMIFGAPKTSDGRIGKYSFVLNDHFDIQLWKEDEMIHGQAFARSAIFSQESLKTLGVTKIVLIIGVKIESDKHKLQRVIEMNYTPDQYSTLTAPLTVDISKNRKLTLNPE